MFQDPGNLTQRDAVTLTLLEKFFSVLQLAE